jgi:hypothetical protein
MPLFKLRWDHVSYLIDTIVAKILTFTSTLSSLGKHAVHVRDDQKLYNQVGEAKLMTPFINSLKELAQSCVKNGISLDLFYLMSGQKTVDIASHLPLV